MNDREPANSRPWYLTFHDLMPFRVHEILLLSSPYDAFTLEEDGRVTERIFSEYSELSLSSAPRITHVSSGARAMELLRQRRFDLVISMLRVVDTDISGFSREVKRAFPALPVVLLVLSEADLLLLPDGALHEAIDYVFVWTGDGRILVSIIKLVEDAKNAEHDASTAGVRVIIVVEDSARRYSSFLTLLYEELLAQSESLAAEGVNPSHRLMRMRTRHKILLATDFDQALEIYRRFPEHTAAVISDVRLPHGKDDEATAGLTLVQAIRELDPDLPILLESIDPDNAALARARGIRYLDKGSPDFHKQLRAFVTESLGFGDFIFRLPDRAEVARARDMYELEQVMGWVPAASIEYHATRNHFSTWLLARSMFALAALLRHQRIEAFGDIEEVRRYLLAMLHRERVREQQGVIADLSPRTSGPESHIVRLAGGSVGGKARGLGSLAALLARSPQGRHHDQLPVRTPRSVLIGSDEFDRFVEAHGIIEAVGRGVSDGELLERCLAGDLSPGLTADLRRATADLQGPLAVRSSSLLEDSQLQPFAGVYATYMLPNVHPDPEVRVTELCRAIKAVYASTYTEEARAYVARTPYALEDGKMAVMVQQMVGRAYGGRFYPTISGVALSYNYYPFGRQRADEGAVLVALGLGHTVVRGGNALQFSPGTPEILPQYASAIDFMRHSQTRFYALDLTRPTLSFADDESSLVICDLDVAEADGTLALVGSTYSREDDIIRDNLAHPGARLVTFNNILKWQQLPLAPLLVELLALGRDNLGCPVEIEFAVDMPPPGSSAATSAAALYVLQIRPQATQAFDGIVELAHAAPESILCRSNQALGHGVIDTLRDIVYVKRHDLDPNDTPEVARQVGEINQRLAAERAPYLLLGPGRWGSSDPRLGIPVKWAQITGAKVIVETTLADRNIEPSQGAHFFHNLTSFRIGYLTLGDHRDAAPGFVDTAWLEAQPAAYETRDVRHIRLRAPLRVLLDGRTSSAIVQKPVGPLLTE